MITTNALPTASGQGRRITLWTISGLVALAFPGAGGAKLAGVAVMVELFDTVRLGQWFRHFTGALEVVAGFGLLISQFALYAAVLLGMVMASGIIAYSRKAVNANQQRSRT
jgi:putative oxidoreductase